MLKPRDGGSNRFGVSIDYHRIEPPVYAAGEFERFVKTMQPGLNETER